MLAIEAATRTPVIIATVIEFDAMGGSNNDDGFIELTTLLQRLKDGRNLLIYLFGPRLIVT
ncbi:hypothetical protein YPPY13_1532, partial [Yersinia pestis PY-13]